MNFKICLGCNGRIEGSGFTMCNSAENIITEIDGTSQRREELLSFLDSAAGMFDADIYDWNKIMNVISHLKDVYNCIPESRLLEIQMFCKMHRACGLYLRLEIL